MKSEASIDIARPIEDVFEFTTTRVADWSLTVVEDHVIDEKPGGVGTTFRTITADHGHRMAFDGVVTRHERPKRHTVFMKGQKFDIEADYLFEDLGGSTRVTQHSTIVAKGLMKILFGLLGKLMTKAGCHAALKELTNLKAVLEAETPA